MTVTFKAHSVESITEQHAGEPFVDYRDRRWWPDGASIGLSGYDYQLPPDDERMRGECVLMFYRGVYEQARERLLRIERPIRQQVAFCEMGAGPAPSAAAFRALRAAVRAERKARRELEQRTAELRAKIQPRFDIEAQGQVAAAEAQRKLDRILADGDADESDDE
jgi:hypothetical protein